MYRKYPKLVEQMMDRYQVYNETLEYIEEQESKGNLFVIRPIEPLQVGRMEKDPHKLAALYDQGYRDAGRVYDELVQFLEI